MELEWPPKSLYCWFLEIYLSDISDFLYEIRGPWIIESIICWFSWKILAFPEEHQEIAKICFFYFLSKICWDFDSEFMWFCTWWERIKITQKHSLFRFVLKIRTSSILNQGEHPLWFLLEVVGVNFFFNFYMKMEYLE